MAAGETGSSQVVSALVVAEQLVPGWMFVLTGDVGALFQRRPGRLTDGKQLQASAASADACFFVGQLALIALISMLQQFSPTRILPVLSI